MAYNKEDKERLKNREPEKTNHHPAEGLEPKQGRGKSVPTEQKGPIGHHSGQNVAGNRRDQPNTLNDGPENSPHVENTEQREKKDDSKNK